MKQRLSDESTALLLEKILKCMMMTGMRKYAHKVVSLLWSMMMVCYLLI